MSVTCRLRVTAKLFNIYLAKHGPIGNTTKETFSKYSGRGLYDLGNNDEYFAEFLEAK